MTNPKSVAASNNESGELLLRRGGCCVVRDAGALCRASDRARVIAAQDLCAHSVACEPRCEHPRIRARRVLEREHAERSIAARDPA